MKLKKRKDKKKELNQNQKNGLKFGCKKTEYIKEWASIIKLVENSTINNIKAMKILELKKTTYYNLLKEYKNSFQKIFKLLV